MPPTNAGKKNPFLAKQFGWSFVNYFYDPLLIDPLDPATQKLLIISRTKLQLGTLGYIIIPFLHMVLPVRGLPFHRKLTGWFEAIHLIFSAIKRAVAFF